MKLNSLIEEVGNDVYLLIMDLSNITHAQYRFRSVINHDEVQKTFHKNIYAFNNDGARAEFMRRHVLYMHDTEVSKYGFGQDIQDMLEDNPLLRNEIESLDTKGLFAFFSDTNKRIKEYGDLESILNGFTYCTLRID